MNSEGEELFGKEEGCWVLPSLFSLWYYDGTRWVPDRVLVCTFFM